MADYRAQFEALRELSTTLTRKEEPDAGLWVKAGMKPGTRLKDVNNEITRLKKLVSAKTKEETKEDEEEEDDAPKKGAPGGGGGSRDRMGGRDKKMQGHAVANGDFDLGGDRVWRGEGGLYFC